MSFLDQDRFSNPLAALDAEGGVYARQGADVDDLIAIGEFSSREIQGENEGRNIRCLAEDLAANPDYIRVIPPDWRRDIDNRAADRVAIEQALAIGKLSTTQAQEQGE